MNLVRRRRLLLVIVALAAAGLATALVALALSRNASYLFTPSEVLAGRAGHHVRFRLGGMVQRGSFQRAIGSMDARFRIQDGDAWLPVVYRGILPDLFGEEHAVIATGSMHDGTFVATEVLAKHDETYMPVEVAEKVAAAHRKHGVQAPQ